MSNPAGGQVTSLRRRVMIWLLPALAVLLAVNAVLSYSSALTATNLAYDRALVASIRAISERSESKYGKFEVDIPSSALEIFAEGAQERVFYAVFAPDGTLITGYPDLLPPQTPKGDGVLTTGDSSYHGEAVRVGSMRKRLYDAALQGRDAALLVVVAETTESRTDLALHLFYGSLKRQLALVGLGVLLLLAALSTAFRPLMRLRDTIRGRLEEDLTPISQHDVPSEIRPLIDAINSHMGRISAMLEARKRFLADAAHQMRTPLAVLSTQAEYGLRQDDPAEMRRTLQGLNRSIGGARRLTDQMLSLSRAEAVNGLIQERTRFDLAALVRDVALELAPLALHKQIDLSYEGGTAALMLTGNESMLRELVANLVDNAIRYTPAGGQVSVVCRADGEAAAIGVSDSGPGIAAAEREKVFKRFYRILDQSATEGSGLGLSIVREICHTHGGEVRLDGGPGDRGLSVSVRLPYLE